MRLLLELLQEEYSQMQEAENSEELAKHELSIKELIRQLLKEREEMRFWITSLSSPESGISDIIHMFPEEYRKELGAILKELDILEASCNKQAEKNADMAMALVEQSNNTPMRLQNGEDNPGRVIGGSLAAEFNFRDNYIGDFREKINSFA